MKTQFSPVLITLTGDQVDQLGCLDLQPEETVSIAFDDGPAGCGIYATARNEKIALFVPLTSITPEWISNVMTSSHDAASGKMVQDQPLTEAQQAILASVPLTPRAAAANVVPMPTKAPAVDTSARIKLGELNALIAPLSITADGLESLGFPVVATDKTSKLYQLADVPAILAAMVAHIEAVQAKAAA